MVLLGPGVASYQPRKGGGGGGVGQGVGGGAKRGHGMKKRSRKEWAHHQQAGGARLACRDKVVAVALL